MEIVRLITIHPALVHFSLGTLPLLIFAYFMAMKRRSGRWSFVGDALLFFTALVTLATAAFGLVSFVAIDWPGGLALWRWLHLALGALTGALLIVFAAVRLRARRNGEPSGAGAFGASAVVGVVALFTGWIGGEALVFHSGVAVSAAAEGALAPPWASRHAPPSGLEDAMYQLRGHWASATVEVGKMLVLHPTQERFDRLAADAGRIVELAQWLQTRSVESGGGGHDGEAEHQHAEHRGEQMRRMAASLGSEAQDLLDAANERRTAAAAASLGRVAAGCVSCHEALRWRADAESTAASRP